MVIALARKMEDSVVVARRVRLSPERGDKGGREGAGGVTRIDACLQHHTIDVANDCVSHILLSKLWLGVFRHGLAPVAGITRACSVLL